MEGDHRFWIAEVVVFFLGVIGGIWEYFCPSERLLNVAYFRLVFLLVVSTLSAIPLFILSECLLFLLIPPILVLFESLVAVCIHHRYRIYRYFKKNKK